jgi:hypothetical protein
MPQDLFPDPGPDSAGLAACSGDQLMGIRRQGSRIAWTARRADPFRAGSAGRPGQEDGDRRDRR